MEKKEKNKVNGIYHFKSYGLSSYTHKKRIDEK